MNSKVLLNDFRRVVLLVVLAVIAPFLGMAQTIRIDFSQSGRQQSEVQEPDYEYWGTYEPAPISQTFKDVSFTLNKEGDVGKGLKSNWYKNGIGDARLANDGVMVEDGTAGAAISITISGLKAGVHSLTLYLSHVDNPETNVFAPFDVFINGELVGDNIEPTARVTSNYDAKTAYFEFEAVDNEDVVFVVRADMEAEATNRNVIINGLILNAPNPEDQASTPVPTDADEHVLMENGNVTLSWNAAGSAVSHNLYIGESLESLESATEESDEFKGNQEGTTYEWTGLNTQATYYWRVDEVSETGKVTTGAVWYFRGAQLAFAGAEGYGRFARGARGGRVVHVTNLNDSGEGSFRHAIENESGPRFIVFDVSGIISLQSRLTLNGGYITVAGQTAPGKGICIRNAPFGLSGANDVIIQNVRVRRGSDGDYAWGLDGMGMQGSNNCLIDHCSISWTIDESFSSRNARNISLQRTLISEALNSANHPNYSPGTMHGYAASIGGDVGSFHHNLLAHNYGRNWSLAGGLDGDGFYAGRLDIRNNVVYNWGHRATDGGTMELNFVGNYYKPGAATDLYYALSMDHEGAGNGTQRAYFAGNVMPGHFDETNQEDGRRYTIKNSAVVDWETFVDEPFFESYVNTQTAKAAYKNVLSDVGCVQPVFDDHDQRMIRETLNGTYTYDGSKTGLHGLPDDQDDVGGWEDYPAMTRNASWDTDKDGLPDWWENHFNLNVNSVADDYSDTNAAGAAEGYTQMDDYLYWMSLPHYFIAPGGSVQVDLSELFRGYTSSPQYTVLAQENASTALDNAELTITPQAGGMVSVSVKVTDSEGDEMEREVVAFVTSNDLGDVTDAKKPEVNTSELLIRPNPVAAGHNLTIAGNFSGRQLLQTSVVNKLGATVREFDLVNEVPQNGYFEWSTPVNKLSPGVYFLIFTFEDGTESLKFIKL